MITDEYRRRVVDRKRFGWTGPSGYYLPRWCFAITWMGPIRHVRVLGFYVDLSSWP